MGKSRIRDDYFDDNKGPIIRTFHKLIMLSPLSLADNLSPPHPTGTLPKRNPAPHTRGSIATAAMIRQHSNAAEASQTAPASSELRLRDQH